MTTNPKRRWFAYSLRTLFVVVTVFGYWLGYELNWIRERRLVFDSGKIALEMYPTRLPDGLCQPPWPLRMFGERPIYASNMVVGPETSDAELRRLRALFPEIPIDRWPHH